MALLLRRPVWRTVTSRVLLIGVPSLPLVTLRRWMENLEALAISWKICEVEASEGTETVSGRPLIGRPGRMLD
jgi:hypothetical protein